MSKQVLKRAVDAAIRKEGSRSAVAKKFGVSRQAIDSWFETGVVPAKHVLRLEQLSEVPRYELRPDIYGKEPGPLESRVA